MSKILIIAEKPSVATDLARVLPKGDFFPEFDKKGKGRDLYYENEVAIVISAVGHLVELKMPTTTEGKSLPWKFDALPAIPQKFELLPIEKTAARLKKIIQLAKNKSVTTIINACDAGREGELIFQYILEIGGISKPVKRLWMRSMTQQAILTAWKNLRPGEDLNPLAEAAKCRSESDWLVGLNATRALTCFCSRHGGFNLTPAGRVQTPTLAILAKREQEILNFTPTAFQTIQATFQAGDKTYSSQWIDPDFKKDPRNNLLKSDRLWDSQLAETIKNRCQNSAGEITETHKDKSEISPLLYDLTSLQRSASKLFGLSASRTLKIAQALYDKHKVLTYPRTDSRYLPEDYLITVKNTLKSLGNNGSNLGKFAKISLEQHGVTPNKRIFNNSKVSDHFAIIPTGQIAKLDETEYKLYSLVAKRFIAIFFPPAKYNLTKRLTTIIHNPTLKDVFQTTDSILVEAGWKEVYGNTQKTQDQLENLKGNTQATAKEITIKDEETQPPARYTEATLLSAMEGAGKLVEDEELKAAMSERGLGTPATRASIIEGLILSKYLVREKQTLYVSKQGLRLFELLQEMHIETLSSPALTGEWEYKLHQIEQQKLDSKTFMKEIKELTEIIVNQAKNHLNHCQAKQFPPLDIQCPKCKTANLKETDVVYECTDESCEFRFLKQMASRLFSPEEIYALFKGNIIGPLTGFRSRFQKPFKAKLKFNPETLKIEFVFDDEETTPLTLSKDQWIKEIKFIDGKNYDLYQTEKLFVAKPQEKEDQLIRINKTILDQPIESNQVVKLLTTGKTDLLENFVSKRTKRPFSAYLKINPKTQKTSFEFDPKTSRKAKKTTKKPAEKKPN